MSKDYIESDILLAMIMSTEFMTYIKDPLEVAFKNYSNERFIQSKEIELIMRWVLQYFNTYGKAPQKNVQSFAEPKLQRIKKQNPEQYKLVYSLLYTLSEYFTQLEEQEINAGAQWDIAKEYFNVRRMSLLSEQLKVAAENTDIEIGNEALNRYNRTESTTSKIEGTYSNIDQTIVGLEQREQPLIQLPGALGRMINPHMIPGGFVSFLGSEKRGKSWWLLHMLTTAARKRIPTVMFQAGDMSTQDVLVRLAINTARRSNDQRYCKSIYIPIMDCAKSQRGECTGQALVWPDGETKKKSKSQKKNNGNKNTEEFSIEKLLQKNKDYQPCCECLRNPKHVKNYEGAVYWRMKPACTPLSGQEINGINQEYMEAYNLSVKNEPSIITYSAGELSVSKIKADIERVKNTKHTPRLIIIDYMDLLQTEMFKNDFRNAQYELWKGIRGLAQSEKCLIVSATQANAASYQKELLEEDNFSEDKRKNGLVTALFGLNQTPKEKEMGIMRINTILAREGYFDKRRTVTVLQCLQMGQPVLGSFDT